MPDPGLHDGLDALARYAETTGSLGSAADVRGRGDRRRRARYATSAALALVVVGGLGTGIVLARDDTATDVNPPAAAVGPSASPSPSPVRPPTPSVSPSPSAGASPRPGIPGKDRRIMVQVVDDVTESVLLVGADGGLGTYPIGVADESSEFVLTPLDAGKPSYHLETALPVNGKRRCVVAPGPSAELKRTTCDADAASQEVTLERDGKDRQGRPAYRLIVGGLAARIVEGDHTRPASVTGEQGGGARFVLLDVGKAPARTGG